MSEKYKDIDYSLINLGPLYVDPAIKKPGFEYCFVGNLPGQIEYYQRLGYEVVKDEEGKVGLDKPSTSTPLGAAVSVQSKCGQILILMKIPTPLFDKLQTHIRNQIKAKEAALGKIDGIPLENQHGSLKISRD